MGVKRFISTRITRVGETMLWVPEGLMERAVKSAGQMGNCPHSETNLRQYDGLDYTAVCIEIKMEGKDHNDFCFNHCNITDCPTYERYRSPSK